MVRKSLFLFSTQSTACPPFLDTVETIKNELQNAKGQGVELKNNKANLEAECELLREKVMELEQEIMIVEDQKELSAEHKAKGKLEKVLSELMEEQKAKEELERQLDYAENQIEELENQLDGVDDQNREREDIIHELQEAKQKLQTAEKSAQKSVDEQKKLQEKLRGAIKEAENGARNMQDEKRLISLLGGGKYFARLFFENITNTISLNNCLSRLLYVF